MIERNARVAGGLAATVVLGIAVTALAAPAAKAPTPREPQAIGRDTDDPAIWGQSFPLQYETWLKTVDMVRTKFGGSEALPWTPKDPGDPRTKVSQSKIDEDPRLKALWAGYAFAIDFREERGHAYMLLDQRTTKRVTERKQPGTCLNCHASMVTAFAKAGNGDATRGFEAINQMTYADATKLVKHPVACIDCHDPETMALRVTRPAFVEGMRAWKASQGVKDYDVNARASQKEMRAFVCGQCHVEYYFKGAEKRLVFPWAKGLRADEIAGLYDDLKFADWKHARTGASALKAQHPEFEMWNQGIHARSGVTCVDCHMPEITYQGARITDHQVNSPVLKLEAACARCHDFPAAEMKARVDQIQERHTQLRNAALDAVVALIADVETAQKAGRSDAELATPRYLQRRAQFLVDFVEAENSTGFHAPQESARVLGLAADLARQGQVALRDPSFRPTIAVVDVPAPPPPPAPAPSK